MSAIRQNYRKTTLASKITVKQALINQQLASSLEEADKLVLSKRVLVDGIVARFGGDKVSADQVLTLTSQKKYFSRAGEKLEFALTQFQIRLEGKVCADVGASTGGFTGVLLAAGVKKVYAIDVARGEIAWKLRSDPAVVLMERTNARDLKELPEKIDFVCMDVSFISVSLILPNIKNWICADGLAVVLVKPQFEAPRDLVEKGGIIRDKNTHLLVLQNFVKHAEAAGFVVNNFCRSPIEGAEGNREFLAQLSLSGIGVGEDLLHRIVEI